MIKTVSSTILFSKDFKKINECYNKNARLIYTVMWAVPYSPWQIYPKK